MIIKGCSLDKNYTTYDEIKKRCVIAQGWSGSGDVSFFRNEPRIDIFIDLIDGKRSKKNAFESLFQITEGEIFLAFEGDRIVGICEVPKSFEYVYQNWDYSNCIFPVNWVDWGDITNEKAPYGYRPRNPIFKIHQPEICSYVKKNWETYKRKNGLQVQLERCNNELEKIRSEMPFKIKKSKEHYINLLNKKAKMNEISTYINLLESNKNIILTGAPGTGKTFLTKEIAKALTGIEADGQNQQFGFVQFHPSYDYTDFVEGLRPIKTNDILGFKLRDGIFMAFCKVAAKPENKDKKYVFVIDEINRGEISKVFGELFFSIDPGYRGEQGKVKTQYANLHDDADQYFYVPDNVFIIGTMNDIDRSVESFDFAMRRRFAWKEITAKDSQKMFDFENAWKDKDGKVISIKNNEKTSIEKVKSIMDNLNKVIVDEKIGLSPAYQIGAAYFLKLGLYFNEKEPLECLWSNHLKGLLSEYLRGTPNAIEKLEALSAAYNDGK